MLHSCGLEDFADRVRITRGEGHGHSKGYALTVPRVLALEVEASTVRLDYFPRNIQTETRSWCHLACFRAPIKALADPSALFHGKRVSAVPHPEGHDFLLRRDAYFDDRSGGRIFARVVQQLAHRETEQLTVGENLGGGHVFAQKQLAAVQRSSY